MKRLLTHFSLLLFPLLSFGQQQGSIDTVFDAGTGANNWIYSTANFSGDRLIIGGRFNSFRGQAASKLALLTPFGTVDPDFSIGTGPDSTIWSVASTIDNKIVIGGLFQTYNGVPRNRIARILPDGTLDTLFKPGQGANNWVRIVLPLADKKIIIGGDFTTFNGENRPYLARLNEDGSIDTSFKYMNGLNGRILKARITPDGKIIIGGTFTSFAGSPMVRIGRLNQDGSRDTTFLAGNSSDGEVRAFAFQPDGKTVIGGYTTNYKGQTNNRILRINQDGSIDPSFYNPPSTTGPIYAVEIQSNGKLLVCGAFLTYDQKPYPYLVRLMPDGKVDTTFKVGTGPNDGVEFITLNSTGRAYLSGNFTSYNGRQARRIVRIFADSISLPDTSTSSFIQGKVFVNQNGNCTQEAGEKLQLYRIVKAEPGPYWASTSGSGNYQMVVDTGTYSMKQVKSPLEQLLEVQNCPPNGADQTASLAQYGDTAAGIDFSNTVQECPLLKIEVSSNRRRRCFRNQTFITVSNFGTATSIQPKVYLKLPHLVHLVSASQNFNFNSTDSLYVFEIDSILPNQMRVIHIVDSVACVPGVMGLEQCTQVWATPANSCIQAQPNFDGVNLVVTGSCTGFVPQFKIKNTGAAMTSSRNYQIFSDSLLVETQPFLLAAGDSIELSVIGADPFAVVRLEVPQSLNHPFSTFASATAPCNFAPRPSDFFAQNDEDPITATSCMPILDSYDPNDKLVSPKGSTSQGNVLPGKYFTYTVRFQNTGNDTAYTVVVVDTLDPSLDPGTLEVLGSSHTYSFSISGKGNPVLKWRFANILLPDSFVNVVASNGFLTFRVKAKPGTPLGTQIKNNADIYFDFNDPIRTNTTLNTLYIPTVTPGVIDSVQVITAQKPRLNDVLSVKIYPNPTKGKLFVECGNEKATVRLLSVTGKEVLSARPISGPLELGQIPKGLYHMEISTKAGKAFRKIIFE
jgi:uncharacterized delta-60 repeat protein/uncharacterized repeat protein (TIGR01451 family)